MGTWFLIVGIIVVILGVVFAILHNDKRIVGWKGIVCGVLMCICIMVSMGLISLSIFL